MIRESPCVSQGHVTHCAARAIRNRRASLLGLRVRAFAGQRTCLRITMISQSQAGQLGKLDEGDDEATARAHLRGPCQSRSSLCPSSQAILAITFQRAGSAFCPTMEALMVKIPSESCYHVKNRTRLPRWDANGLPRRQALPLVAITNWPR